MICALIPIVITFAVAHSASAISEADLYRHPSYMQTVDPTAPIIEPEKTLELLKQLKDIVPKTGYWENVRSTVDKLIKLATDCRSDSHCEHDDEFRLFDRLLWDKPQHPNIMVYIKHCKLNTIDHCKSRLKEAIVSVTNVSTVESLGRAILPKGVISLEQYRSLSDSLLLADGVNNYLRFVVDDFDEKRKRSSSMVEIQNKLEELKMTCGEVGQRVSNGGFVETALRDRQLTEDILKDRELIELSSGLEACSKITKSKISIGWSALVSS